MLHTIDPNSIIPTPSSPHTIIHTTLGKRWKFSLVSDGVQMILFGGARLWHGYASDNSVENGWESFELMPEGGFMDDM